LNSIKKLPFQILLFIVFVLVITPIAYIWRLIFGDVLRLKLDSTIATYRLNAQSKVSSQLQMEKQS
jgi:hypothetical protein